RIDDFVYHVLPPGRLEQALENACCRGHKTGRFRMRSYALRLTGDPAIVRLSIRKPLRPVVLRPHLSVGLPLNSWQYYAMGLKSCKGVFQGAGVGQKAAFNPSKAAFPRVPRPPACRKRPPRPL